MKAITAFRTTHDATMKEKSDFTEDEAPDRSDGEGEHIEAAVISVP